MGIHVLCQYVKSVGMSTTGKVDEVPTAEYCLSALLCTIEHIALSISSELPVMPERGAVRLSVECRPVKPYLIKHA